MRIDVEQVVPVSGCHCSFHFGCHDWIPSRFIIHNSQKTVLTSRTEKNQSGFYFGKLFIDVESVNLHMQLFLSLNLKIYQKRGGFTCPRETIWG